MSEVLRISRRELGSFFGSPVAYIFIGTFLAVSLFVFFWADAFFSRNIADARPLFEWMPILLIFLCGALTMRLFSEERRAGTIEVLLTLPVATPKVVLGKFLAVFTLIAIAVALTIPLPITISILGPLDWGPVLGAYLATLLLAAAYLAIGSWVSVRTDNPIVALIGSTLICALFYLLGSPALTHLFGHTGGELLRLIGTGSRFESITRGVIDLRDFYYYLSLIITFLILTGFNLERLRWAEKNSNPRYHRRWVLLTSLAIMNLIAANTWLHAISGIRLDLTAGRLYTISDATRNYLGQLQEPLLIRGYFSAQTHPLLAPLVPQIRDLLAEFQIAGHGKVRVEFIDPQTSPDLEREAGEQYGIRPVAFQTANKYQAAVVNSYFDLLVKYGDQYETLGFKDLIEVKVRSESELEVRLRNPEYDLTRTIKKVLYGYRGGGEVLANLTKPLKLEGFISDSAKLPQPLPNLRQDLDSLLSELVNKSNHNFSFEIKDPEAGDGALVKVIKEKFGFEPLLVSLLDPTPFYFYLVLESGDQTVPIPLPESLDRAGLSRAIEAGIKRFAPGILRTIALYAPPAMNPEMEPKAGGNYALLEQTLREGFTLKETDLKSGQVPEDADLLLVLGPDNLDQKQQFAIDQFLMQGGTVIVAAAGFKVDLAGGTIMAHRAPTGLEDWLSYHGITLKSSLVLDLHNTPFPIPVQRNVGGFTIQEIQTIDYPYFPDIRTDGLAQNSGVTANLGQITLNWASPLELDAEKNKDRQVVRLIESSAQAWSSESEDMQPDFSNYGQLGFAKGKDLGRKLLAFSVEGKFNSPFAGKPSPLLKKSDSETKKPDENASEQEENKDDAEQAKQKEQANPKISGVIESSPAAARLILISSASFLTDTAINLANEATQSRYLKPIELIQNAADWALEDRGLLALRGRGQFSRLLAPLSQQERLFWESLNYLLAFAGLTLTYILYRRARTRREQEYLTIL